MMRPVTIFLVIVATWVGISCTPEPQPPSHSNVPPPLPDIPDLSQAPPPPSPAEWNDTHTKRVELACGSCHRFPPPGALPRDRWREMVLSMAQMPIPAGLQGLSAEDLVLSIAYYTREAPEALPRLEPESRVSDRLRFQAEQFTPRGLEHERIPAVAHVNFVRFSDPVRFDLFACEMRTGALLVQSPWGPTERRSPRPLPTRLNYPVHTSLEDVDGDGRPDLLVAGIGGMNPSNDVRGSVHLLQQETGLRFRASQVATGLARPADVRAIDLDGDGDRDLIVSAFGWRGPGELRVYENRSPSRERLVFEPRVIDDRDGFIHVEPADFDGDGRPDFVTVLSQEHEEVIIYHNRGGWRFEAEMVFQGPHPSWGYSGLELVDFDGDTDPDLLVSNGDTLDDDVLKPYHGITWFENRGNSNFQPHPIAQLYGCERAVSADLDLDGDLDVVAVSFLPQIQPAIWKERNLDSLIWYEREGEAWIPHAIEKHACYHPTVAVADYDADGKPDIAVGNYVWLEEDSEPRFRADYITLFTAR